MNLVCCLPFALFYNSSDSIVNYLIYKIGSIKMKQSDTVKKAIVSMLNDYQDIKNMHLFLNHADKKAIVSSAIDNAFKVIHPLLNEVHNMHDVPFNITADLIAYETWLLRLTKSYSTDLEVTDIAFKCRYELPQSGYDCVYLDYESDKPFLSLV